MQPDIHGLSQKKRLRVFILLVLLFLVVVPILWVYASGYRLIRLSDTSTETSRLALTQTGGFFIGTPQEGVVYVDDVAVNGSRFFQNARYVSGIKEGTHHVYVTREGYHTWVKDLSVQSQIVTEAIAFLLPETPKVRIITPLVTVTENVPITSSEVRGDVEVLNTYALNASTTEIEYKENDVYTSLFEEYTASQIQATTSDSFVYATTTKDISTTTVAYPILDTQDDLLLIQDDDDVLVYFDGTMREVPFFVKDLTVARLATSTVDTPAVVEASSTFFFFFPHVETIDPDTIAPIPIDRQSHMISDAVFYPYISGTVLVSRDDGVYVTEVDPRAWQNTQLILKGEGLHAFVYGGVVYVYEDATEFFYEIVVE